MFSVSASPYNSLPRQLYGGWLLSDIGNSADIFNTNRWDEFAGRYQASPEKLYRDSKWATMAMKYSPDPDDARRAKAIKAILKGRLPEFRKNPAFKSAYALALAGRRSPAKKPPLPGASKVALWRKFLELNGDAEALTNDDRVWLSMASKAPFTAAPVFQAPYALANAAQMVTGPYGSASDATRYAIAGLNPGYDIHDLATYFRPNA